MDINEEKNLVEDATVSEEIENVENEVETKETVDSIVEEKYTSQFAEIETEDDDIVEEKVLEKPKKKLLIQVPIIIAGIIVIGALLGYLIFTFFFAHTIQGTWSYQGADGSTYYYTFENDNKCNMYLGTITFVGDYQLTATDTAQQVTIDQYYGELAGNFTYEVTGSKILNNQELTLKNDQNTYTLKQDKVKKDLLTKPESPEIDENIIGKWEYVFEDYGVSYKFVFNKDGTMQINQYDSIIYDCTYSAKDNNISCTFFTTEETTQELPYKCDGTTLSIMGLDCTRIDKNATKDQVAVK